MSCMCQFYNDTSEMGGQAHVNPAQFGTHGTFFIGRTRSLGS